MIPPTFQPSTKRARLLYQVLRLGELKSRQQIFDAVGWMLTNNAASELNADLEEHGYRVVHSVVDRLHCYRIESLNGDVGEGGKNSAALSVVAAHSGDDALRAADGDRLLAVAPLDPPPSSPTSPESDGLAGGDHGSPGTNKSVGGCCQLAAPPANPSDVTSEPTVPISLNPTSEIARPPGEMGRSAERLHADTFEQLELVA